MRLLLNVSEDTGAALLVSARRAFRLPSRHAEVLIRRALGLTLADNDPDEMEASAVPPAEAS